MQEMKLQDFKNKKPTDLIAFHQHVPGTNIVVLANRPTAAECTQMLSFGATGCISKETQARDIVNAIHLASRGMHVLDRLALVGGDLTAREEEVLELLQDGRTNSEIAKQLSIGIETVRTHARSIYRKLGVPSRRELARMARREPVVVDEERRPVETS